MHPIHRNAPGIQQVEPVLDDIGQRFGIERAVFAGDRGMMTSDNLERIRSRGQGYLLGLKRRHDEPVWQRIA